MEEFCRDFREFKDFCMGIFFYGFYVKGEVIGQSDVDVCFVKLKLGMYEKVLERFGGKYDVKVFEELFFYIQIDVIKNYWVIYGDEFEFLEYFYRFRKFWNDMEY